MIFKMSSLHKFFFTYICPRFYGGAPSTPSQTTQTQNQNTIPAQLMPYMLDVLNKGQGLTNQGYTPYSTNAQDYVAPFSPLQQQAQQGAAGLQTPGQFAPASYMAGLSGVGSMMAGQNYAQQATDPNAVGAYMNPYLQQSLAPQLQLLNQQYGIEQAKQQGAATQAGAFGGSREALMSGLVNQNQSLAQQKMISEGYNQAFNQAQQAQQYGAGLNLQGMGQGIQAAGQLGGLGTAQLGAQTSVLGTQSQFGGQQQQQQQQAIDQSIQNYQNAQNYPYMQLGFMSDLIRGTPTKNTTETVYQAQPSTLTQLGGALGTAGSLYGAATAKKAEGGSIKDNSYAQGGIVGYFGGGSVEGSMRSKLENMTPQQLQEVIATSPSNEVRSMAKEILAQESYARGGIVAFANGGEPQDWKSSLENISQEMTARDYKLHGWTDEDIAEYKSSGRVPLDPQKQLALRAPEAEIPLPNEGESGAYNRYEEIQRNARRVPESEVINLGDDNARKPRAKTEARVEPIERGKGIDQFRPEASAKRGPQKGLPRGPIEGEYVPASKPTAGGALGAPEQEPIESRKMYSDETKRYKEAMAQREADMAAGKKQPMNKGMEQEQLKARKKMGAEATVERPTGATAETPTPKAAGKGLTAIKGLAPVALKTLGTLSLPELVDAMTGQPEDSKTFKEYEDIKKKSGMKGVLAHMQGQVAEGNEKVAKGIAAFTSENIAEPVKKWWSGEEGQAQEPVAQPAVAPSAPAGIDTQAQEPLVQQDAPLSADANNPIYTQRKQQPPMGAGSSGVAPPAQQPSFGGTAEESEILRANLASEPEEIAQAVNTAAEVATAKTEQDMPFYMKQVQEMYKQQGLGNNEGADAMRQEIMGELANKDAEEKRQTYLRMAEFFSHWGSTPGAPLAAGMRSLIATMPGYLEDKKDQAKLQRGLQDSLYKLNQADRLEKFGMIKEAAALKHEASQFDQGMIKLQHEAIQNRLQNESDERKAKIMAGASTTNAVIGATSRIEGTTSDTYRGNNIKALQNQADNIARQMGNLLPGSKELAGLKKQLADVNRRMDALINDTGAKPKTRYDSWLTETGKI